MTEQEPRVDAPGLAPLSHTDPKKRTGWIRVWYALGYSVNGLRAGWAEPAFRQEACAALVLIPTAIVLGQNWIEVALLIGSVLAVMVVELLNTAVESAIDRIGPEWHDLSKRAKDMGSAAVLLCLLWAGGVWCTVLYLRLR